MLRILTMAVLLRLPSDAAPTSSDVISYTRVSRNGQLARSSQDSLPWIGRPSARNESTRVENESRSINDVVSITRSPVYVPTRTPKLKKGEALDHPAAVSKYSTLDHDMIAKLDAMTGKHRQIQHRFHAPAIFGKPQKGTSTSNAEGSMMNSSPFPGPLAPDVYDVYSPPGTFADSELPPANPMISKYPPVSTDEKDFPQDSYRPPSSNEYHSGDDAHETEYPGFDVASYGSDGPTSKPMKFSNHHDDQHQPPPSFTDDSYGHQDDFYHQHEIIYDHVPEFYGDHHYHHKTTTEEPEMNDQRLDKRPYSYYFIGKKLWYIPLYFSIYFIIYIAALVLKSIARHKINFPAHLADAVATHRKRSEFNEGWWSLAGRILEGTERFAETSDKNS